MHTLLKKFVQVKFTEFKQSKASNAVHCFQPYVRSWFNKVPEFVVSRHTLSLSQPSCDRCAFGFGGRLTASLALRYG